MTDNLRIWNALGRTDPAHTKNFTRSGGFKGTAMKPIWMVKRLTEQFGPCGTGWGMGEPRFQTVTANEEILVFCTVRLWYREADSQHDNNVYGVGGDKVLGKNKYGPFTNDEAFKASYTDALSNAMKQIGVGADIHMGLFDDEKYVRETTREFAENDWAKEAVADGLAKDTTSNYDATKASKAKEWADSAIEVMNLTRNPEGVKDWRRLASKVPEGKRKAPLEWLRDNSPGQYLRVRQAYQNATGEDIE